MRVVPIILSGGSGAGLSPLLCASNPKKFPRFGTPHSLIQETALLCRSDAFDPRPIVVGEDEPRFLLAQELADIGLEADILLEPVARNTCAAIAAGCLQAVARDPEAVVLVLAADHFISDTAAFARAVEAGVWDAMLGFLVTFGVKPDRPATGYGYIEPSAIQYGNSFEVASFIAKPTAEAAADYVARGFLWNTGNLLFQAKTFLAELARLAPEIASATSSAFADAQSDLGFLRLGRLAYSQAPSISVDDAIMERTRCATVLPVDVQRSDVGSWDDVSSLCQADGDGHAVVGDGVVLDGRGNLIHSEHQLVAVLGLDNIADITTKDSTPVASRERASEVKGHVTQREAEGRWQTREAPQMPRSWGNYEQLDAGPGYQVKRLTINSSGISSPQKYQHCSGHWVLVRGEVEVTIGDRVLRVSSGESFYIRSGESHRLANDGGEPAVLIEVQTGSDLGDDDIIRPEDVYNRPATEALDAVT